MDVVFCVEQYYFKPAIISAISLLSHIKEKNKKITIHILHDEMRHDLKSVQSFFVDHYNSEIKFYSMDNAKIPFVLSEFNHQRDRFDAFSTFYRLLLPEILPDLEKVLYLDADTIISNDISELFNINLQEFSLGAVIEPYYFPIKGIMREQYLQKLGKRSVWYFNAGVLLMNLKKMREENFISKCIDFYKKNKDDLYFGEQDIMNAVLEDKVLFLPPKFNRFNVCDNHLMKYSPHEIFLQIGNIFPYTLEQMREANKKPSIIHYLSDPHVKPWHYPGRYYMNKEKYWHFYNKSLWKDQDSILIEKLLNKIKSKKRFWGSLLAIMNVGIYIAYLKCKHKGLIFRDVWDAYMQEKARFSI